MTALLLVLAAQEIPDLLRDLEAHDIEVRDRAEATLSERPESDLPRMREALAGTSGEARSRLERAIVQVPLNALRRAFGGGAVVNGLTARVRLEKDRVKPGEKLVMTLEIANVSETVQRVCEFTVWDVVARDTRRRPQVSGAEIAISTPGAPAGEVRREEGCIARVNASRELKPGETCGSSTVVPLLDLSQMPLLAPGDYTIVVTYYARTKRLLDHAEGDLVSNVLRFTVEK